MKREELKPILDKMNKQDLVNILMYINESSIAFRIETYIHSMLQNQINDIDQKIKELDEQYPNRDKFAAKSDELAKQFNKSKDGDERDRLFIEIKKLRSYCSNYWGEYDLLERQRRELKKRHL